MYARLLAGREHHRARAVAEQHAGAAVVPVEDAREHFGADHQSFFVLAGFDERVCGCHGIDEAAAYRLHIECRAVLRAELRLQQAGGAGKDVVGGGGRDNDQVDLGGRHARRLEGTAARLEREVARGLGFLRDVALDDTGAAANPGVARIEPRGELVVHHDARRQVAAGAGDPGINHWTAVGISAIRAAMRCGTLFLTSSTARSSAWPKA